MIQEKVLQEYLEELEELISRRLPKGASKYEGKLSLKYFSCNKIRHFA